jgi:hypothetical protein
LKINKPTGHGQRIGTVPVGLPYWYNETLYMTGQLKRSSASETPQFCMINIATGEVSLNYNEHSVVFPTNAEVNFPI